MALSSRPSTAVAKAGRPGNVRAAASIRAAMRGQVVALSAAVPVGADQQRGQHGAAQPVPDVSRIAKSSSPALKA